MGAEYGQSYNFGPLPLPSDFDAKCLTWIASVLALPELISFRVLPVRIGLE